MAQNIALDKSSQSTFVRAIKNIKTLMKKNEEMKMKGIIVNPIPMRKQVMGIKPKRKRRYKVPKRFLSRGVVYLSHIPKGFYEKEMFPYFKQFGEVTRLRLARSKVTGKSKGYAFIEYLYSEVAQVVAETMNNYLLNGKILKAKYIPGDQVRRGFFAFTKIRPENCQRSYAQTNWIEKTNKLFTDEELSQMTAHELKRLKKLKKQMQDIGIDYDCQVEGDIMPILKKSGGVIRAVKRNVGPTLPEKKNSE